MVFFIDKVPDEFPLGRRQGFDEQGYFRRVEIGHLSRSSLQQTLIEVITQLRKIDFVCCFDFHHGPSARWGC